MLYTTGVGNPISVEFYGIWKDGTPFMAKHLAPKITHKQNVPCNCGAGKRVICLHDAPHSIALFLQEKDRADFAMHNWVPFEYPNVTGFTIAYTQQYHYPLVVVRALKPVEQFLVENGVPYPPAQRRWCTTQFKIVPTQVFYRQFHLGGITQLLGITKYQSSKRSAMWSSVGLSPRLSQATLPVYQELPIFNMTDEEQLRLIQQAGIELNPYYLRYGPNGHGCVWCFYKNPRTEFYTKLKAQDPALFLMCEYWRHTASGYIPKKYPPDWEPHEYYWDVKSKVM